MEGWNKLQCKKNFKCKIERPEAKKPVRLATHHKYWLACEQLQLSKNKNYPQAKKSSLSCWKEAISKKPYRLQTNASKPYTLRYTCRELIKARLWMGLKKLILNLMKKAFWNSKGFFLLKHCLHQAWMTHYKLHQKSLLYCPLHVL